MMYYRTATTILLKCITKQSQRLNLNSFKKVNKKLKIGELIFNRIQV